MVSVRGRRFCDGSSESDSNGNWTFKNQVYCEKSGSEPVRLPEERLFIARVFEVILRNSFSEERSIVEIGFQDSPTWYGARIRSHKSGCGSSNLFKREGKTLRKLSRNCLSAGFETEVQEPFLPSGPAGWEGTLWALLDHLNRHIRVELSNRFDRHNRFGIFRVLLSSINFLHAKAP